MQIIGPLKPKLISLRLKLSKYKSISKKLCSLYMCYCISHRQPHNQQFLYNYSGYYTADLRIQILFFFREPFCFLFLQKELNSCFEYDYN